MVAGLYNRPCDWDYDYLDTIGGVQLTDANLSNLLRMAADKIDADDVQLPPSRVIHIIVTVDLDGEPVVWAMREYRRMESELIRGNQDNQTAV
jgi:hypothetical protein